MDAHRLVESHAHPVQRRLEAKGYLVVVRSKGATHRATAFCRDDWALDRTTEASTPDEALRLLAEAVEGAAEPRRRSG